MPATYSMNAAEWALLVTLSVLWGASFMFIEIGLRELTPFNIVAYRISIAAIVLVFFVVARGHRLPADLRTWGAFAVLSLMGNVIPFSLIMWGQIYIDSGLASILNATTPIFAVTLAHFCTTDEPITRNRVLGILLAVAGVSVMIGPEALAGMTLHGWGQLAVLGAAFCYGCAGVYARRFRGLPSPVISAGSLSCGSIIIISMAMIFESGIEVPQLAATWGSLLWMAVLGTALAYVIYYRLISTAGVTNTSLVTFLVPIVALILGAVVLGERLNWHTLAGMLLIFAGLAAVDGRILARLSARSASPSSFGRT